MCCCGYRVIGGLVGAVVPLSECHVDGSEGADGDEASE